MEVGVEEKELKKSVGALTAPVIMQAERMKRRHLAETHSRGRNKMATLL